MTARAQQHIVVVDDEPDLRKSVGEYLELQGYAVSQAGDGSQLHAILANGAVDLVLLDLRMPGEDGLAILRQLRQQCGLPVIMVTAMGDPIDRIIGLEVGADDYVVKPFEFRELLARIRTVLRRAGSPVAVGLPSTAPVQAAAGGTLTRIGCCFLDLQARRLYAEGGEELPLSNMEFDLLKVFVARPNRVLNRDQLLDLAHNDSWEPFDRSIDIRVARLRKKIERDPTRPEAIRTVRGAGYMFVPGTQSASG